MKCIFSSLAVLLAAAALSACAAGGYIDAGDGSAHHVAKCPKGTECVSTLKVGAAAIGSDWDKKPADVPSGWQPAAKPSSWKNPDSGPPAKDVKLDSERNIYILRKPEPVAVPSVAPEKKGKPKKDGPTAKPADKKAKPSAQKPAPSAPPKADGAKKSDDPAASNTGPPPRDVIPPPGPPINLVPKG